MKESTKRPTCFGDIKIVFPKQPDGLRVTPDACMQCEQKTPCLRTAMAERSGLCVREEMIDRAYRRGLIGFLQRWSQKKNINRLKKSDI